MRDLSVCALIAIWMALVAMWLSGAHGALLGASVSVAVIIAMAFAKSAVVGAYFMNVRNSARWLRLAFGAWIAVVVIVFILLAVVGTQ